MTIRSSACEFHEIAALTGASGSSRSAGRRFSALQPAAHACRAGARFAASSSRMYWSPVKRPPNQCSQMRNASGTPLSAITRTAACGIEEQFQA